MLAHDRVEDVETEVEHTAELPALELEACLVVEADAEAADAETRLAQARVVDLTEEIERLARELERAWGLLEEREHRIRRLEEAMRRGEVPSSPDAPEAGARNA
jgi:hypothetical protein